MRTTLTLDEEIGSALKEKALRSGRTFKDVVNETLRAGLESTPKPRRYRLKPASLGGPVPGINLDRALRLADALEDEALAHRIELRK